MEADSAIPEIVWAIEVNGRLHAAGTASPGALDALAVGRLVADGFLLPTERPLELRVETSPAGTPRLCARVQAVRASTAFAEAVHRVEHGCGLRHFVDCAPAATASDRSLPIPPEEDLGEILRGLFSATRRRTGGVHTIGLWDGERLIHVVEEVGRHAGVDKACGWAITQRLRTGRLGLVLTARISGEIALKAARSRLAWVASRSVPTSLAVEIAAAAGLPLIARAASRDVRRADAGPAGIEDTP